MVSLPGEALPGADKVAYIAGAWSVAAARESAWIHARILSTIAGDATLSRDFTASLDGVAALAGKALLICA
jgi:hypothetical protein